MTFKEFKELCVKCWNRDKYNFILIDKDSEFGAGRYRKIFDDFTLNTKTSDQDEQSSVSGQGVNMDPNVLDQIAEARKSIRRKSLALKLGREAAESALRENLKPITEPLEKIAENLTSNPRKRTLNEIESQNIDVSVAKKSKKKKKKKNDTSAQFESAMSENLDNDTVVEKEYDDQSDVNLTPIGPSQYSPSTSFSSSTPKKSQVDQYLGMLVNKKNTNLDIKAGIRYFKSGEYKIGDTQVYFSDNSITAGNSEYPLTDGLTDLLFKRNLTPYIQKTDQVRSKELREAKIIY